MKVGLAMLLNNRGNTMNYSGSRRKPLVINYEKRINFGGMGTISLSKIEQHIYALDKAPDAHITRG